MAGTYEQSIVGELVSTGDLKILAQLKGMNELLNTENKLGNTLRWYTPTIVATEQERESTSYGTLTTADEVKNVVLPANGLIVVGFVGLVKSSVGAAGSAAIFLGSNQLKTAGSTIPEVQSAGTVGTGFNTFTSYWAGLRESNGGTSFVTTGQSVAVGTGSSGGPAYIFAEAGTYDVSVQFKATSGKVVAKERKLWVGVIGV
jgi:hypothetical protein